MSTQPIKIVTRNSDDDIRVDVTYRTGDFAVHPTQTLNPDSEIAKLWTVTHVPTGFAVTSFCKTDEAAREIADFVKAVFARHNVDTSISDNAALRASPGYQDAAAVIQPRVEILQREFVKGLNA